MKKRTSTIIAAGLAVIFMNGEALSTAKLEKAVFAGGCFWCMESAFEKIDGVVEVISGYTGGHKKNPTYEEVSAGVTGHVEAIEVFYDPQKITYAELLDVFWRQIDPTDPDGQFVDRGGQYGSAIFYRTGEERNLALESLEKLQKSGKVKGPIVTKILPASKFYIAEEYHQDYYKKNPIRYKYYRNNSGRDRYLQKTWGAERNAVNSAGSKKTYVKPPDGELKKKLTPLQYEVTQRNGTEPAFDNKYWNNKREGIYVDIVSGEPLFSSKHKYESGTGWPSFTRPLVPENIVVREDNSLGIKRTEVRSKHGDSHLGHVFDDGPQPEGLRYCMNSAALRFIPGEELEKEGYGEFVQMFK